VTKKAVRRSGVLLDREQLDYQLGLRACTSRDLARQAGVHEVLLSRARHGQPITERTLRKITNALLRIPLHPGAELLIAPPKGAVPVAPAKKNRPSVTSRAGWEAHRASGKTSR
jgi:hypothetical protein